MSCAMQDGSRSCVVYVMFVSPFTKIVSHGLMETLEGTDKFIFPCVESENLEDIVVELSSK